MGIKNIKDRLCFCSASVLPEAAVNVLGASTQGLLAGRVGMGGVAGRGLLFSGLQS